MIRAFGYLVTYDYTAHSINVRVEIKIDALLGWLDVMRKEGGAK